MKSRITRLGCSVVVAVLAIGCSSTKKQEAAPEVPVQDTLTDPVCKDEAVRLCLHRFPAPDVERVKYDSCLREEYAECLAK